MAFSSTSTAPTPTPDGRSSVLSVYPSHLSPVSMSRSLSTRWAPRPHVSRWYASPTTRARNGGAPDARGGHCACVRGRYAGLTRAARSSGSAYAPPMGGGPAPLCQPSDVPLTHTKTSDNDLISFGSGRAAGGAFSSLNASSAHATSEAANQRWHRGAASLGGSDSASLALEYPSTATDSLAPSHARLHRVQAIMHGSGGRTRSPAKQTSISCV